MKLLLFGLVLFFVFPVVMAVVFRDQRARGRLSFLFKLGWGYVIGIVILALWRAYSG